MPEISDPYYPVECQDFHQAASLELVDPSASVPPACLKVTASLALCSPDISTSAPFMEVDTSVPALPLADLYSAASSVHTERQAVVPDQAVLLEVPASAREADLEPLALTWEEAPEAAVLS